VPTKEDLRKEFLKKMQTLSVEEIKKRSRDIQKNLEKLELYQKAKRIMIYYPLKGEVDLLDMVRKAKKDFCFPKIEKEKLVPYQVKNLETDFEKGKFGIKEPIKEKCRRVNVEELDLVIVPGLVFDRERNRLGRGKGYYDRFLKELKEVISIGVAFNFQIIDSLPYLSSHDEKVDILVSESEIL